MSRFNLPVFKSSAAPATPEELFRRAMHAEEIQIAALGETLPFDFGQAILCPEFPLLKDHSQVRDVTRLPGLTAEQIIGQVDAAFAARKVVCNRWHFADGIIPADFKSLLEPRGYTVRPADLWLMQRPNELPINAGLTIIPGRASFEQLAAFARSATEKPNPDPAFLAQLSECVVRTLDDTRMDTLLALAGDDDPIPVGRINLVTNGESGLITDLRVHPAHRRQGIAATLLMHLIEFAARSRLRHLMLFCRPDNEPARALYMNAGFSVIYRRESLRL